MAEPQKSWTSQGRYYRSDHHPHDGCYKGVDILPVEEIGFCMRRLECLLVGMFVDTKELLAYIKSSFQLCIKFCSAVAAIRASSIVLT